MDQPQTYLDLHQPHLSAGQAPAPQTATSGSMAHYAHYGHPPLLQPVPASYPSAQTSFGHYSYPNGVTSPQTATHPSAAAVSAGAHVPSQLLPLPAAPASQPLAIQPGQQYGPQHFDTTGQIAPPGMKPRVTATLWEDEGSLCFQVEAKGICVARRDDNHMINGTKLLNVAGMTRGRRDGILKSEKTRHVVKIGPMHLKGVWIPFDRALDFANREKITHLLYPLFVHNISALLCQTPGHGRTSAAMAAAERRRLEQRTPQTPQSAALHHSSIQTPIGSHLPGPSPQQPAGNALVPSHAGAGRPGLERAHTFPTPPTSAHSILGMPGAPDASYSWNGHGLAGQSTQPLSVDVGLGNARSLPSTPASTPPGNMQSTQPYTNGQTYDHARSSFSAPSAPPSTSHYGSPAITARYGPPMQQQPGPYIKHEMRPPAVRAPGTGPEADRGIDSKAPDGLLTHAGQSDALSHPAAGEEEEGEHEHETGDYGHENNAAAAAAAYNANRTTYGYSTGPAAVTSMPSEHAHMSPEMNGSPGAHTGSGRATPRTTQAPPPQWTAGYNTPPRAQGPSSNLYSVMSHDQLGKPGAGGSGGGPAGAEGYPPQMGLAGGMQTGYGSQPTHHAVMNGASSTPSTSSNKRMRDMDDDGGRLSRPSSRGAVAEAGGDMDGLKRRKTLREDSLPTMVNGGMNFDPNQAAMNRPKATAIANRRR